MPKAPQRRVGVPRRNSLAEAYRSSRSASPPTKETIQEEKEVTEEVTTGLEYFPLWLGVKAIWWGVDWCVGEVARLGSAKTWR